MGDALAAPGGTQARLEIIARAFARRGPSARARDDARRHSVPAAAAGMRGEDARARVCVVQTDPTRAETVAENVARVDARVRAALTRDRGVGMVVCPELGFSRYALRDEDDARAVARESARALAWAREIAMTYDTHVALGHCREEATSGELFNSQTVFAPDGDVARRYDKSHLYFVDEAWAVEGRRGFEVFTLAMKCFVRGAGSAYAEVVRDVKCVSAICMDINPYKFEAPWTDFELANACVGSDLILFSSAWTSAHPDDPEEIKRKPVDFGETVSYWMSRLQPLLGKTMSPYFVCANRIGVENDIQFTGCSCIVDLRHRIPRLMLGVREREETALSCWIELGRASDDDDDDDGGETDALGEHNHSDAQ